MAIGFSSCNDDEDGPPGKFTFNGKTYQITKVYAESDGSEPVGDDVYYYWTVYLVSSGISYNTTEEEWSGTGDAVLLYFWALNDDSLLPPGTYTDDDDGYCDGVYIGYNVVEEVGDYYGDFDSVSFTISKSGNTYTINFTIETDDGEVITGSFTGSVSDIS